jgi:hypothetical protein
MALSYRLWREEALEFVEPLLMAKRFARSLDAEDYASTAECLAPTCEYEIRGRTYRGPDAILASYRESADWAALALDGIRYESTIRSGQQGEIVVEKEAVDQFFASVGLSSPLSETEDG